jgi:hypothetical protein
VCALAALVLQAVVTAGPAGAAPTPPERVKIWTANLNQFRDSEMELVDNIQAQYNRPDFVALSGVSSANLEAFRSELQSRFAGANDPPSYLALHGETPNVAGDAVSNVGIIWDAARFTRTGDERWLDLLEQDGTGACVAVKDGDPHEDNSKHQLGMKFKDKDNNDRSTVVASIHINRHAPDECDEENVRKIHNQLETLAPVRRLTLVAGDFNMSPDNDDGCQDTDDDDECVLPEQTPDCWYLNFSATNATCDPDPIQQHSYVDTAGVEARAASADAICAQWTRGKDSRDDANGNPGVYDLPPSSDYCHDHLDGDGHAGENGVRDRNRIDYIWARWEDGQGNAITTAVDTVAEAASQVIQASADTDAPRPGDPSVRYSDHRGVHAAVKVVVQ